MWETITVLKGVSLKHLIKKTQNTKKGDEKEALGSPNPMSPLKKEVFQAVYHITGAWKEISKAQIL